MATRRDLDRTISAIASGILQVIDTYNLTGDLPSGKDTNIEPNIAKIFNKEFGWAIGRGDYETAIDMISEWYQILFLERADKLLGEYTPSWEEGHISPLLGYLKLSMIRAAQQVSIKFTKIRQREQQVNPIDDESYDDALNRIMNTPKSGKIIHENDPMILELEEIIEYYEANPSENNDKKLKKAKEKLDLIFNPKKVLHDVDVFLNKEFDVIDEIAYERILADLKKIIKGRQNYEIQIKILDLLLADFAPSEIARLLNVSAAKISQRKKTLLDDITKLAKKYSEEGDSTLDEFLEDRLSKKNSTKSKSGVTGNRKQETNVECLLTTAALMGIKL